MRRDFCIRGGCRSPDCRIELTEPRSQVDNPTATESQQEAALLLDGEEKRATHTETASRARRRGAVLARMLYSGDALAAILASFLAIVLLGEFSREGMIFVLGAGLLWPFAAFSIGLYRSDQLSTWASAVSEVPRGFVAVLLITWPLFGVASRARPRASDRPHLPHRGRHRDPRRHLPRRWSAPACTAPRTCASAP